MVKDFGSIWEMLWDMIVYLPRTLVDLFRYGEINGGGLLVTFILLAVLVAAVRFGWPCFRTLIARRRVIAAVRRICAERGITVAVRHGRHDGADLLLVGDAYRGAVKFFPCTGRGMHVHVLNAETCLISPNVIDLRTVTDRTRTVSLTFPADTDEKIMLFIPRAAELTRQRPNGEKIPLREGEMAFDLYLHSEGTLLRRLESIPRSNP